MQAHKIFDVTSRQMSLQAKSAVRPHSQLKWNDENAEEREEMLVLSHTAGRTGKWQLPR